VAFKGRVLAMTVSGPSKLLPYGIRVMPVVPAKFYDAALSAMVAARSQSAKRLETTRRQDSIGKARMTHPKKSLTLR